MVRNILASFVAVIGLVALYLIWTPAAPKPSARQPASAPNVEIAPTSDALSFARLGKQTIAVSSYANGRITGLPVGNSGEDAISLVNRLGYDGVRALIAAGGTPVKAYCRRNQLPRTCRRSDGGWRAISLCQICDPHIVARQRGGRRCAPRL